MSDAGTVTNGKFRITYDPQKLTLEEAAAGDGLADTMVQVNDPVTGNKQEGEIVFVFAAAQPISIDGTLLRMNFNNKGMKEGETEHRQKKMRTSLVQMTIKILKEAQHPEALHQSQAMSRPETRHKSERMQQWLPVP